MADSIQYEQYLPSPDLCNYISRYAYNKLLTGFGNIKLIGISSGKTELYFYLNNSTNGYSNDKNTHILQSSFVVGIEGYNQKTEIALNDTYEALMIEFQPGAFYNIFGIAESELVNWIHDFNLLGCPSSGLLIELISMADSNLSRIKIFEAFVRSQLRKRTNQLQPTNIFSVNLNNETNSLKHICNSNGMSIRQLERKYKETIGICPIQYQQIHRINNTFKNLHLQCQLGWISLSLMLGYYDQSHFIKEFKNQTGITPSDFIEKVPVFFYNQKWSNRSYIPIQQ